MMRQKQACSSRRPRLCGFGVGGKRRSDAERLNVSDELPALRLRKLGPNRHASAHDSVGQNPKDRSGRGVPDFPSAQAWTPLRALGVLAVAFRTVALEEKAARSHRIGILFKWISLGKGLFRRLGEFRIGVGILR